VKGNDFSAVTESKIWILSWTFEVFVFLFVEGFFYSPGIGRSLETVFVPFKVSAYQLIYE